MSNIEIEFNTTETRLLAFILEVTINRQQNYIAEHTKKLIKIDKKLDEVKRDIDLGKKSFFYNPKIKYEELRTKRQEIARLISEPKHDLAYARHIYKKVIDANNKISTEYAELSIDESLLKDRDYVVTGGSYKKYFKIEHFIY